MRTIIIAICLCVPVCAAAEFAGNWELTIDTPRGVQHPTLEVVESDGVYSGTYHSQRGPVALENVKTDGATFSFDIQISIPIGNIDVTYTGEIDGDKLRGDVVNPRGKVPFTGERKALESQ